MNDTVTTIPPNDLTIFGAWTNVWNLHKVKPHEVQRGKGIDIHIDRWREYKTRNANGRFFSFIAPIQMYEDLNFGDFLVKARVDRYALIEMGPDFSFVHFAFEPTDLGRVLVGVHHLRFGHPCEAGFYYPPTQYESILY